MFMFLMASMDPHRCKALYIEPTDAYDAVGERSRQAVV
jgi:hypothetical protein